MAEARPDFSAITQRQQKMWAAGDFSAIGVSGVIVGELLCEAVDLNSGQRVLDVATGSGNTAIAAARRDCHATGVDFVPALLERARERTAAERLDIDFIEGSADNLPVPDASFDAVLSTFGVMFAPDQATAARELIRACTPGGKIGLACWTPESLPGQMFQLTTRYLPPPPGLSPPTRWGTEEGLRELFGDGISDLRTTRRHHRTRYRSPEHYFALFSEKFGPIATALGAMAPDVRERYTNDLTALTRTTNLATDGTVKLDGEYLEIVATRA